MLKKQNRIFFSSKFTISYKYIIHDFEASYLQISLALLFSVAIEIAKIQFLWKPLLLNCCHQSVHEKLVKCEWYSIPGSRPRQKIDNANSLQWPYELYLSRRKIRLLHFACICWGEISPEKQNISIYTRVLDPVIFFLCNPKYKTSLMTTWYIFYFQISTEIKENAMSPCRI